ncbi:hypothetical protein [Anabaena catenula]|uniref:Uncharacterized protein n=1 Tax=Anabaena catenula FACHB-362 TaxID=2692877 RepID=A0ABR8J7N0_9NOST|nr:hypothetical protein [Anabaena catenula]MBD2693658.1 hypothetical protein [Anabaena catenula FACHB-362]
MLNQKTIWGSLIGLLLLTSSAVAEMPANHSMKTSEFHRIEQPFSLKVAVTVGGLALIGIELWWFIYSKSKVSPTQLTNNE